LFCHFNGVYVLKAYLGWALTPIFQNTKSSNIAISFSLFIAILGAKILKHNIKIKRYYDI
jgi:hypothetical protein